MGVILAGILRSLVRIRQVGNSILNCSAFVFSGLFFAALNYSGAISHFTGWYRTVLDSFYSGTLLLIKIIKSHIKYIIIFN